MTHHRSVSVVLGLRTLALNINIIINASMMNRVLPAAVTAGKLAVAAARAVLPRRPRAHNAAAPFMPPGCWTRAIFIGPWLADLAIFKVFLI